MGRFDSFPFSSKLAPGRQGKKTGPFLSLISTLHTTQYDQSLLWRNPQEPESLSTSGPVIFNSWPRSHIMDTPSEGSLLCPENGLYTMREFGGQNPGSVTAIFSLNVSF